MYSQVHTCRVTCVTRSSEPSAQRRLHACVSNMPGTPTPQTTNTPQTHANRAAASTAAAAAAAAPTLLAPAGPAAALRLAGSGPAGAMAPLASSTRDGLHSCGSVELTPMMRALAGGLLPPMTTGASLRATVAHATCSNGGSGKGRQLIARAAGCGWAAVRQHATKGPGSATQPGPASCPPLPPPASPRQRALPPSWPGRWRLPWRPRRPTACMWPWKTPRRAWSQG